MSLTESLTAETVRSQSFQQRLESPTGGFNALDIVGREFEDRNLASGEVLLITNILIGSDEEIEISFSQAQQFAVLDTGPAPRLNTHA